MERLGVLYEKGALVAILIVAVSSIFAIWLFALPRTRLSHSSFGVCLTEEDSIVFSGNNILSYNKTDHAMRFTFEAMNRTGEMMLVLHRIAPIHSFVLKVDGDEIYFGRFVSPTVSRSFPPSEVITVFASLSDKNDTVTIQMGYPWRQPSGEDPWNNAKVLQYFEERGKLVASFLVCD